MKIPFQLTVVAGMALATLTTLSGWTTSTPETLWDEFLANPHNHSHIPDGSYAGYMRGEVPIPDYEVVVDATDYGAVGDGSTDNTWPIRKALEAAAAKGGGAVYLPAGNYVVQDLIVIKESHVVLRGAGTGQTTLTFANPLENVLGSTGYGSSKWNWAGGLIWINPGVNLPSKVDYTFVQNTPADTTNGGPGHAWEFWFHGATLASVSGTAERGTFTLTVDDASSIQPGETVLLTWAPSQQLFEEIGDHPAMIGEDYGSWLEHKDSFRFWRWPVEVKSVSGNTITLVQPLRIAVRPEYNVKVRKLGPRVEHSGVEDLTIVGNARLSMGHNTCLGWNGVAFNKTLNCWVRNVEIINMENGFLVSSAKNVSLIHTEINGDRMMHHPYTCRPSTHDTLYEDFRIELDNISMHGINTEWLSTGNVWSKGWMNKGTFDSHRAISFDYIRTEITLKNDKDSNPGGANQAGRYTGRRVAHWNVTIDNSDRPDVDGLDAKGLYVYQPVQFVKGVQVGMKGASPSTVPPFVMPNVEKDMIVAAEGVTPAIVNLYEAQLAARADREAWIHSLDPLLAPVAAGNIAFPVSANVPAGRSIAQVALEIDGSIVATDTTAPYAPLWLNAPEGGYQMRLRLRDDQGTETYSESYNLTVGERLWLEETTPSIVYGGSSQLRYADHFSGGQLKDNMTYFEYSFVGTRVQVRSSRTTGRTMGRIYLDDFGSPDSVSQSWNRGETDFVVYDSGRLPDGVHHLRVEKAGENLPLDYLLVDSTGDTATTPLNPRARFTLSPTSGVAPLPVTLTGSASDDPDGNIVSYEWDFDSDGTIDATGPSVQHTFTNWDTFVVSLTVTDNDGLKGTSTKAITVVEPIPVASIAANPTSGDVPLVVSFDASASTPSETFRSLTNYSWDFENDGNFDASGVSVSHTYTTSGVKTVRLRVTDDYGRTNERTITINVLNDAPTVDLAANQSVVNNQLPTVISLDPTVSDDGVPAGVGHSYQWSILEQPAGASGQFSSDTVRNPNFTMDVHGGYSLQLLVNDGDRVTTRTTFIAFESDASGAFIGEGGVVVMEAENYNRLTASSNNKYWVKQNSLSDFSGIGYMVVPDGNVGSMQWEVNPGMEYQVDFQQTGYYNIWVRRYAPDGGGNSAFFGINGFEYDSIDNNNSNYGEWIWKKAGTKIYVNTSGLKTLNIVQREDGYRIDKIILTTNDGFTPNGVSLSESQRDGNEPPEAQIAQSTTSGDSPLTVTIDGTGSTDDYGIVSYSWDVFQDGSIDGTGSTFSTTFTSAGVYPVHLTVTDTGGKTHSTLAAVTVDEKFLGQPPVAQGTISPLTGKAPLQIILDASTSYDFDSEIISYSWDFNGDGIADASGRHAVASITEAGEYQATLTVRDNTGLSTTSPIATITANPGTDDFNDPSQFSIAASSYLGGSGTDEVVGVEIQSSGVIVIAAQISDAAPGGVNPILLNGATSSSSGAILRLTPDGQTVLSVTRLAERVEDLSLDDQDRIYVAAATDGAMRLDPLASQVQWTQPTGGYAMRIDADPSGEAVVLNVATQTEIGIVFIIGKDGGVVNSFAGHNYSQDVVIDSERGYIYLIGYAVSHSGCNPVHISYLHGIDFSGQRIWKDYDWPGTILDDCDGDGWENNMADTRGYRIDLGQDGLLYAAFEAAGGNHIFRRDPHDITVPVTVVGGDQFESFTNTLSEHKTFFAKYNPDNGDYILGQQLTGRIQNSSGWLGNSVRMKFGGVTADEAGRIYIWGSAAEGLPLPSHPLFQANSNEHPVDPYYPPGAANSGAFVLVSESSFQYRTMLVRPSTAGEMRGLGVRRLEGESFPRLAFGGSTTSSALTYTTSALQGSYAGGDSDGFLTVMTSPSGNIQPWAYFTSNTVAGSLPLTVNVDASQSLDADGTIVSWEWDFDNNGSIDATGSVANYTYTNEGHYSPILKVTDNNGATDEYTVEIQAGNQPPKASFIAAPQSGIIPLTVNLDASTSSDTEGAIADYSWDFNRDGIEDANGITVVYQKNNVGNSTVTLTVTDANGATDSTSTQISAALGDLRPAVETAGLITIEAEEMATIDQNGDTSGSNWVKADFLYGFVGSGYIVFPGSADQSENSATGSRVVYNFTSSSSGTVRVWLRRYIQDGISNSAYLRVNNSSLNSIDNEVNGIGYWEWVSGGTYSLGSGNQQLELRRREIGYAVDRIVLARDSAYVPVAAGPVASPRTGNAPPVAILSAAPVTGDSPLTVSLDGSNSSDPDGSIVSYVWDWNGDGIADANGQTAEVEFTESGNYEISLIVTDNNGSLGLARQTIVVDPNNLPVAVALASPAVGPGPLTFSFDGAGSSDEEGDIVAWAWDFNGDWITDATGPSVQWTFAAEGEYLVRLQVTDMNGSIAFDTVTVQVSGLNNPPVAVDDAGTTDENIPVLLFVLNNDTDADIGDTFSIDRFTHGSHGTVSQSGNQLEYTPNYGFSGTDSFNYVVTDGIFTDTGTVTISITDVPTTMESWLANPSYNLSADDRDPFDNPDGDSYDNLMEYVLATNPSVNNSGGIFSVTYDADNYIFHFRLSNDAPDASYQIEWTDDLNGTWNTVDGANIQFVGNEGDYSTYEATVPRSSTNHIFFRLRVIP